MGLELSGFSFLVLTTIFPGCSSVGNPCWNSRMYDIVQGETCLSFVYCFYGYPVRRGWCYAGTAFEPGTKQCTRRVYDLCRFFLYQGYQRMFQGFQGQYQTYDSPFLAFYQGMQPYQAFQSYNKGVPPTPSPAPVQTTTVKPKQAFQCPLELPDGFYPDYSRGCPTTTYFRCKYGSLEDMTCSNSTYFNEGTDKCDVSSNIPCGAILKCPRELTYGVFGDYTNGCPPKSFHRCYGGGMNEAVQRKNTCPEGLYYNEGIKNCDYDRNTPCSVNLKT